MVGHYGDLPAAVWLYTANMRRIEISPEHHAPGRISRAKTISFMTTALASVLISLVAPGYAMYTDLLNIVAGPFFEQRYGDKREA